MAILFILPDIHERPTGGNVYNGRIIESLRSHIRVETFVYEEKEQIRTLKKILTAGRFQAVIIDSLLIDEMSPPENRKENWILMTHYLPFFDPRHADSGISISRLSQFDGYVTTSQNSAKCLQERGIESPQIHVVYPGLDASYRPIAPAPSAQTCRLLTVASLLPDKGLLECIEMLENAAHLDWTWEVVGDGTLDKGFADRVASRMAASSCTTRMRWIPGIQSDHMPALYRSYDVFLSPSQFETLGMAIREAMACGLPVAAFDVGGVAESFTKDRTCLVSDWESFQGAVCRLIADTEFRQKMREDALLNAAEFYSWEEAGRQFKELLVLSF